MTLCNLHGRLDGDTCPRCFPCGAWHGDWRDGPRVALREERGTLKVYKVDATYEPWRYDRREYGPLERAVDDRKAR